MLFPPSVPPGETQGNTFPCTPVTRRTAGQAMNWLGKKKCGGKQPPVKAKGLP
jgi:hypothetical protein